MRLAGDPSAAAAPYFAVARADGNVCAAAACPAPGRLAVSWMRDATPIATARTEAFSAAIGEPVDAAQLARARIAAGTVVVWEDREPVAMAGYGRKTPSGVSISLVYTPDALRGRGYASACVGTLSQVLLDEGNRHVALYTDVTNPISNGIYRKLGYRVVGEASAHALE